MNGDVYYFTTVLVYGGVDAIACLGLSQQFGISGVTNFGFIIFQAAGAYVAGILSLGPDTANGGFQSYIGGWHLAFPLPWIGAAVAGAIVALPFTFLVGRRLRGDFAAVGLLVTAVTLNVLVTNYQPLFDGAAGLSLVPAPLQGVIDPQSGAYQWGYGIVAVALAAGVFLLVRRVTESPYGRSLRAMRDNDTVAESLGVNLRARRTTALVVGGALAGLSGGVLVGFINLWDPGAWGYAETIVLFAAVIIGGLGNHGGAVLGAVLVPLGFEEATRFIPAIGQPGLIPALQWVAIGLLIVLFLWFRPQGIIPERRRRLARGLAGLQAPAPTGPLTGPLTAPLTGPATLRLSVAGSGSTLLGGAAAATGHEDGSSSVAEMARASERGPAGSAGDVALEAFGLVRAFEGVRAVDGASMAFHRGRLTGLIGPNGAGKSTTLAMLAGTLPVTEGQILLSGQDVTSLPAYRRARMGLVRTFQLASEFKRLTVLENLLAGVPGQRGDWLGGALLGPRHWRAEERAHLERAAALLERFQLGAHADSYAGDLSGGQRRLVEIMRALMAGPSILLLDEPMAGVHPRLAHQIGDFLLELCAGGMTIAMVEHELAFMDEFCDPVVVMAEGKVLAQGTMSELRQRSDVVEAYLVG
ncbi:MAG: ATP-binding cassette domain-containing protein [Acidimicrobiales bacterium]